MPDFPAPPLSLDQKGRPAETSAMGLLRNVHSAGVRALDNFEAVDSDYAVLASGSLAQLTTWLEAACNGVGVDLLQARTGEYDGGELVIRDTFGTQQVKLPAGHAVLYPGTSVHQVLPVTRGARVACFFWIESMVRSDEQRRLLYDMDMALMQLRQQHGDNAATTALTVGRHVTPAVQPLPDGLATLADHEAHAQTRLDANSWAYFSGGAGDEITLRANRGAWDRLSLLPRVLKPLAGFTTQVELLGRTLAHPLLVAPMAWQRMAHADGEMAMAHAAAAQGAGLVLSTQASQPLETVAQAFTAYPEAGPLWFQLYLQADRGFTRQLVQRAEAAGYQALVLTVDAPVQGARDRERRAGFRLPPGIGSVHLEGAPAAASLLDT
eukprot:gene41902-51152_t